MLEVEVYLLITGFKTYRVVLEQNYLRKFIGMKSKRFEGKVIPCVIFGKMIVFFQNFFH